MDRCKRLQFSIAVIGSLLLCVGCGEDATVSPPVPAPVAPAIRTRDRPTLDFTGLPGNVELILQLRVAQLTANDALSPILTGPWSDRLTPGFGIELSGIDRLTIGITKLSELSITGNLNQQAIQDWLAENSIIVVHTTHDVDTQALRERCEVRSHGSMEFFVDPKASSRCAAVLNPRTVVTTTQQLLLPILDRTSVMTSGRFEFVNPACDVVLVVDPQDKSLWETIVRNSPNRLDPQVAKIFMHHVDAAGLELDLDQELQLAFQFVCDQPENALSLSTTFREAVDEQLTPANRHRQPAVLLELHEQAQSLARGNVATLGTQLSPETTSQLVQYGQVLMALAMVNVPAMESDKEAHGLNLEQLKKAAAPAARSVNLPEGISLSAAAFWQPLEIYYEPYLPVPPDMLEVWLFLSGNPAAHIAAFGNHRLTSARTSNQNLRQQFSPEIEDQWTGPLSLVYRSNSVRQLPSDRVALPLLFEHPEPTLSQVSELSGQVELLIASHVEPARTVTLGELIEQADKDPLYKSIGLSITRHRLNFANKESVVIRTSRHGLLSDLMVVDDEGLASAEIWSSSTLLPSGYSRYELDVESGDIPDATRLHFVVMTDLKKSTVEYTFKDLPVPQPHRSPTGEQRLRNRWTANELAAQHSEGFRLDARCNWNTFPGVDADGNEVPRPLEVDIELTGPLTQTLIALGNCQITSARTETGPLVRYLADELPVPEVFEKLMPLRDLVLTPGESPRVRLSFDHPDGVSDRLTELSGQLSFVTAESVDVIELRSPFVENSPALSHPDLARHGIQLKLEKVDERSPFYTLTAITETPEALSTLEVLDSEGIEIDGGTVGRTGFPGAVQFFIGAQLGAKQQVPTDATLRLHVHTGLKRYDIPFQFTNVPIPPEPKNVNAKLERLSPEH